MESTIEIWDVRRHHVAKYSLPVTSPSPRGDGAPIDVAWGEDDLSLVSAFSSGVVSQLDVRTKSLPLDVIPRQAMAWSPRGELIYALDRFKSGEIPFDDL